MKCKKCGKEMKLMSSKLLIIGKINKEYKCLKCRQESSVLESYSLWGF